MHRLKIDKHHYTQQLVVTDSVPNSMCSILQELNNLKLRLMQWIKMATNHYTWHVSLVYRQQ